MLSSPLSAVLLTLGLALALPVSKRAEDYIDPRTNGGSMLDLSAGLGEPLNVIVSANSSPEVLTNDGFMTYVRAIGYAEECLGLHIGGAQSANLGDGRGQVNETAVIRESLGGLPTFGTCLESLFGGNHFRFWTQETTGALFLATSKEKDVTQNHDIVDDGYNIGRDELVAAAIGEHSCTSDAGTTYTYSTTNTPISGLLEAGSEGINHGIAIDGIVQLLTVTLLSAEKTELPPNTTVNVDAPKGVKVSVEVTIEQE